jgi:hypothetical protein
MAFGVERLVEGVFAGARGIVGDDGLGLFGGDFGAQASES